MIVVVVHLTVVALLHHVGHVQLASDCGKRLRAAISCHLAQTSKKRLVENKHYVVTD